MSERTHFTIKSFLYYNYAATRENLSLGFPTRSDTNGAVQPQKIARGLKSRLYEEEDDGTIYVAKVKGLINCAVTAQLICAFVKMIFS